MASNPFPIVTSPTDGSLATHTSAPHVLPPSDDTRANTPRFPSAIECADPLLYAQTSFSPSAWIIGHELYPGGACTVTTCAFPHGTIRTPSVPLGS